MEKALNYIDIFAGCGGLSTGLFNAGWHGLFAVEKNADAFSTLKFNLIDTVPHFVWPEWLSIHIRRKAQEERSSSLYSGWKCCSPAFCGTNWTRN